MISVERNSSDPKILTQLEHSVSNSDTDIEGIKVDELVQIDMMTGNEEIVIEPLKQNPYEVSYTCLLLPRLDSHYLLGDVADRLQVILRQISSSFGWHLEFLSIKPDYLQWAIRVPPSTSTTNVIYVVRNQTSVQIFADFPRFKIENPSDDFWAPGYLIFLGSQPHPVEIIQRYIHQTRKQQGVWMDE
jgi:REP element-mobilizing transposase RayT